MTAWDIVDKMITSFPPAVLALILVAVLVAVVIFIVGFSKHGINFLKYGFKQTVLVSSLEKRFDDLEERIDGFHAELEAMRGEFRGELETIKSNHFGHLKNFLTELTSILLDKGIINNENKARLDNQLRGM